MIKNDKNICENMIAGSYTTFDVANNNSCLVVATETYDIHFFNLKYMSSTCMQLDNVPLHVKYYPDGNKLFTTSNQTHGLKVWDAERKIKLFEYKPDTIKYHCYNEQRNISACTNEGMKIYDLRCRFQVAYVQIKGCKTVDWHENTFCAVGYDIIQFGDIRNLQKSQNVVERNVVDAKFYKDAYCCMIKEKDEHYIKIDNIKKISIGHKLHVINDKIIATDKNKMYFFTMQNQWIEEVYEIQNIKELYCKNNFLFILDKECLIWKDSRSYKI